MKYLVTGGAGFLGSHLTDRLLQHGHDVVVYDNFSTGVHEFLRNASDNLNCRIVTGDILDRGRLIEAMQGVDFVYHLSANADVRFGLEHPEKDIEQNTLGTFSVLEAMRSANVQKLAFVSTGSVYGEPATFPTAEDAPFPVQTSLYGASKLAGEGLIAAYAEGYSMQCWIFRLVSILGERYTHGHVFDFVQKLGADPTRLTVLGDGTQRKSYLYVQDCVSALQSLPNTTTGHINVFNLGTDEYCSVQQSVGWILHELGLDPRIEYLGGQRGWVGDSPFIWLDCSRARAQGWHPTVSIRDAVARTARYLRDNPWVFELRNDSEHAKADRDDRATFA